VQPLLALCVDCAIPEIVEDSVSLLGALAKDLTFGREILDQDGIKCLLGLKERASRHGELWRAERFCDKVLAVLQRLLVAV
jgi:hypothetical protein